MTINISGNNAEPSSAKGLACDASSNSVFCVPPIVLFMASFFSPLLSMGLSLVTMKKNYCAKQAFITALAVALSISFCVYSIDYYYEVDMSRWMAECEFYQGKPFGAIAGSYNEYHSGLIVWNAWCWVVGNIGDTKLLQASAAFIGYFIIFWVVLDYAVSRNIPAREAFFALFVVLLLINPQAIVGNVRSTVACLIAILAFYVRLKHKGSIRWFLLSLVLAIAAVFLHKVLIVALVIWVFEPWVEKAPLASGLISFGGLIILLTFSINLQNVADIDANTFWGSITELAGMYSQGTAYDQAVMATVSGRLTHALQVVLLLLLLYAIRSEVSKSPLGSLALVFTGCVLAMELLLVNVGLRLQYVPIILLVLCCMKITSERMPAISSSSYREVFLFDVSALYMCVLLIAFSLHFIFLREFLPSFNIAEVALRSLVAIPQM